MCRTRSYGFLSSRLTTTCTSISIQSPHRDSLHSRSFTPAACSLIDRYRLFQSPHRDSLHSRRSEPGRALPSAFQFQSPHRDSLHSRTERHRALASVEGGFNPRIRIHFIHASQWQCFSHGFGSFNPRIGIHFIHARNFPMISSLSHEFQSPHRGLDQSMTDYA